MACRRHPQCVQRRDQLFGRARLRRQRPRMIQHLRHRHRRRRQTWLLGRRRQPRQLGHSRQLNVAGTGHLHPCRRDYRRPRPSLTINHPIPITSLIRRLRRPARITPAGRLVPRPRAMPSCHDPKLYNPAVVKGLVTRHLLAECQPSPDFEQVLDTFGVGAGRYARCLIGTVRGGYTKFATREISAGAQGAIWSGWRDFRPPTCNDVASDAGTLYRC